MHIARSKRIKNPIHLLENYITIIFCAWGTLANKFLVIIIIFNKHRYSKGRDVKLRIISENPDPFALPSM